MEQNTTRYIGLQFFAEPAPPAEPTPPPAPPAPETKPTTPPAPAEKTLTQEELNSMLAAEKRTARTALLRELGIEVEEGKDYKENLANAKKILDSTKTQAELDAAAKKTAEAGKLEAETKASALEQKLAALTAGVNADSLEDVIALAAAKVSETKTFEVVLVELKEKYPAFFDGSSKGTGSNLNNSRKPPVGTESLGTRLGKQNKAAKSTYFKS